MKFVDDDATEPATFWEECARVAKKAPPKATPTASQGGRRVEGPPPKAGSNPPPKKAAVEKEEEKVRRLFSVNTSGTEFNSWCEQELKKLDANVAGEREGEGRVE